MLPGVDFQIRIITLKVRPSDTMRNQYGFWYTILNNIEVYEEPVPWTKNAPYCAVKFEAGEKNRIVYESLYCCIDVLPKSNSHYRDAGTKHQL